MSDDAQHDLHKVLEITRRLAGAVELDELLALIIERSMELLDAERASIFLYDEAAGELVSRIAAGEREIRFPASKGIAGATLAEARTILVADAQSDPRFNPEVDRETGFLTRNILSLPLADQAARPVGVLQMLNRRGRCFDERDAALGETLAAQAGVSIQRARLMAHYVEKLKMERSMRIARDIQQGLLPDGPPELSGYEVAGFNRPADETGGDTYDWLALPDGRQLVTVADASGHGVGPALVIAQARAMIRALAAGGASAADVLAGANRLLSDDLDGRFVTCFLAVLGADGALSWASAGHGPILFHDRAADEWEQHQATAVPLGIAPEADFSECRSRQLAPGDLLVVTSDGFFEAMATSGEEFGIDRMTDLLRRDRDRPPAEMIANLYAAVREFTSGKEQADDLTAVVIRRS